MAVLRCLVCGRLFLSAHGGRRTYCSERCYRTSLTGRIASSRRQEAEAESDMRALEAVMSLDDETRGRLREMVEGTL